MTIAEQVTQFVLEELLDDDGVEDIDADYDLVASGVIDSLGVLQLMAWLREQFGIAADDVDMSDFRSVGAICRLVRQTVGPVSGPMALTLDERRNE